MEGKYLQVLEFPKILAQLAEYTSFSGGRDLALSLDVATSLEEARRRQRETAEAVMLLDSKVGISLGGAHDVRPLLERATRGLRLLPSELLDIQSTLLAAQPLRRTLSRLSGQFPLLSALAGRLEECSGVVAEIRRCITPKAEVADSASPELSRVRSQLAIARERLLERLERMLMSSDNAPLLQDTLITQRSGRFVIPIKAEYKGRIPGIVHDESASGATLFIEPLATVELNNEWREWQLREEREVARILDGLTDLVAREAHLVERTTAVLAELDFIFAKAQYARQLRAVEPKLMGFEPRQALDEEQSIFHPGTHLRIMRARHPLLPADTVVPVDIYLRLGPRGYFVIVVTGPNTGGKTVALKTAGLLCLMAQAGLHIPAAEDSALSVFENVFADIGDEQSIEQSLSTFSSHMSNIVHILSEATDRSLVLLDELGAGTDPVEGSALARALLTELVHRGVTTLATTHHPELKLYAQSTPGVENASVEFDAETLSPTYELTIGLPGRSNAFAIAERLGLPSAIVERARALVDPNALQADELLTEIKSMRDEAERRLLAARESQTQAEAHEKALAERLRELEEARLEALDAARREARLEMDQLRQEMARLRIELSRLHVSADAQGAREALAAAQSAVKQAEQTLATAPAAAPRGADAPGVGDAVWVRSLQAQGVVTDVGEGQAEVRVGNLRLRVVFDDLEIREQAPKSANEFIQANMPGVKVTATVVGRPELHLRGKRVEEAMPELMHYLDDAYLAGLQRVRIVHGKGTGTLRRLVREELAHHPLVAAVRQADARDGGEGVTIAELVPR